MIKNNNSLSSNKGENEVDKFIKSKIDSILVTIELKYMPSLFYK